MTSDGAVDLSIVIVSYGTRALLQRCLRSVVAELDHSSEVIVVDNASPDGSADMVAAHFPGVRLLRQSVNGGFAVACNSGVEAAQGAWILLLNPDTELHAGTLAALRAATRKYPHAGIYGGRTFLPDGTLDPRSCFALPTAWSNFCFAVGLNSLFPGNNVFDPESLGKWQRDSEREVGMVTGCLLLTARPLWDRLGGMDTRFFLYGEDADFCARARALGARPVVCPEATVTHVYGASTTRPEKLQLTMKGKITYALKHSSRRKRRFMRACLVQGVRLRALAESVGRRGPSGSAPGPWQQTWQERRLWQDGYLL